MLKQTRPIFLSATLLGMLVLAAPAPTLAITHRASDGTMCDDSILDIGGAGSSPADSKKEIRTAKRWEKARAAYERDLDFAAVDAKQLPEDYGPKRDLIEAKYRLALAEGRLRVPNFDKQALADLQEAQSFLAHALQHVDAEDKAKFDVIKGKVDHILRFVGHGGGCWSERLSDAFDNVDHDVENVLHGS